MVVISACISSRVRPLLARQFVDIRRTKVEGLLNAFVKLVDYSGSDHTYLETESVRYVYQPVENLYLVLITTKSSNIFEDLGTLRMFETCGETHGNGSLEDSVAAHAFDIVFMLDELISGGYREALTLQQIQSYVAMDSHEEKLQRMIAEGKEKEQADRRREIAQRLEKEKQAARKAGKGLDISSFRGSAGAPQLSRDPPTGPPTETYWGSSSPSGGGYDAQHQPSPSVTPGPARGTQQSKGMQLGFRAAAGGVDTSLQNLVPDEQIKPTSEYAEVQHDQVLNNPLADPVSILIEEKVKASLQAEGVVKEVELQGTFFVTANDPQRGSLAAFQLTPEDKRFKMKSHPNVDKTALSQGNLLQVRDPSRPLPPHQPAPLLKWRASDKDEVLRTDAGTTEHDGVSVHWFLPEMGEQLSAATIELTANTSLTTLMPFSVEMHSRDSICNVEVLQCTHMETKAEIPFSLTRRVDYLLTVHP
ncbi:coatomer delta subunit, putative [Eimeria praecox]|uniref:Coatomer subunit delta n=1 Tax=Eimeria praecox TaxID=51316 RepID=U6GZZ5_9EIME|nr:coatomer delta subunit, putative [Eimeria praecox]